MWIEKSGRVATRGSPVLLGNWWVAGARLPFLPLLRVTFLLWVETLGCLRAAGLLLMVVLLLPMAFLKRLATMGWRVPLLSSGVPRGEVRGRSLELCLVVSMFLWSSMNGVRLAPLLLVWVRLCQERRRMVREVILWLHFRGVLLRRVRTVCLWLRVEWNPLIFRVSSRLLFRVMRYTWIRVLLLLVAIRLLGKGVRILLARNRVLEFLLWVLLLVRWGPEFGTVWVILRLLREVVCQWLLMMVFPVGVLFLLLVVRSLWNRLRPLFP
mmetsp:Transcript_31257/g.70375  ORF Transcript_31257/g.70375 Transcript_31257/m.70375 type:complete len:268 (+) Transcript_31257:140-943(+)